MSDQIVIADYDPRWPALYEVERQAIGGALGPLLAAIEHIGSTAVPGLAAKPIVDVMAGLRPADPLDGCVAPLQALDYEYLPRYEVEMPFRRFFRKRPPRHPQAYNLHVVHVDSPFWTRHLAFRDYLRAHPETAQAYAAHKRALAPRFADVNEYARAKTPFIEGIMQGIPRVTAGETS